MTMFSEMAKQHRPKYHFEGSSLQDFEAWKNEAMSPVMATVGDFPGTVPPRAEMTAEWWHDGLRKQRWLIDVGLGISAAFLINYPGDWKEDDNRTTILCWHGHGPFGKEPVMGNDTSPSLRANIEAHRYNYGHDMAKVGFITYAINWIGGGERSDLTDRKFKRPSAQAPANHKRWARTPPIPLCANPYPATT